MLAEKCFTFCRKCSIDNGEVLSQRCIEGGGDIQNFLVVWRGKRDNIKALTRMFFFSLKNRYFDVIN